MQAILWQNAGYLIEQKRLHCINYNKRKNNVKIRGMCTAMLCFCVSISLGFSAAVNARQQQSATMTDNYVLVIHGGAGVIEPENLTPEQEKAFHAALKDALLAGQKVLKSGGTALDAVEQAIILMEDTPLFNAGKGSVFTHEERNEMDASIMDGQDLNAGAVSGVSQIKNPISLAREVMTNSRHVMLSGAGAEEFAQTRNIPLTSPEYFKTPHRLEQLQKAKKHDRIQLDHSKDGDKTSAVEHNNHEDPDYKFGTVGAVALDKHGNLAAGTSTGGMTNKRWNRVGDSPIIGAGTYADNNSCAVSATGHGEYFIRATVARSICALMEYKGVTLQEAADEIVMKKLVDMKGEGGIIAVDKDGNAAMVFNTPGMYRGIVGDKTEATTAMYKD